MTDRRCIQIALEESMRHPDDPALTLGYVLRVLREQNHQRIAAFVEWLAYDTNSLMRIAYEQGKHDAANLPKNVTQTTEPS